MKKMLRESVALILVMTLLMFGMAVAQAEDSDLAEEESLEIGIVKNVTDVDNLENTPESDFIAESEYPTGALKEMNTTEGLAEVFETVEETENNISETPVEETLNAEVAAIPELEAVEEGVNAELEAVEETANSELEVVEEAANAEFEVVEEGPEEEIVSFEKSAVGTSFYWHQDRNGKWYITDGSNNGPRVYNEWVNSIKYGAWYYFGNDSYMVTGWKYIGSNWYYFNSSGAMQTGWIKLNGTWYYLAYSGAMQTSWINVNGTWYYMNSSGAMLTGWVKVNGEWYYMNSSGAMQTGWLYSGGNWYFLNVSGSDRPVGSMYKNCLLPVEKRGVVKYYYFYDDGAMASNTSVRFRPVGENQTYILYFNSNGEWYNPNTGEVVVDYV